MLMQTVLCNCVLPFLIGRGKLLPTARTCSQTGCPQRTGEGRASCWGSGRILSLHSKVLNSRIVWSGGLVVLLERWNPEFMPREGCTFCSSICNVAGCILERGSCSLLPAPKSRRVSLENPPPFIIPCAGWDEPQKLLGVHGKGKFVGVIEVCALLGSCSGMTDWITSSCCLFLVLITWKWSVSFLSPSVFNSCLHVSLFSTVCTEVGAAHEGRSCQQVRRRNLKMVVRKGLSNRNIRPFLLSFCKDKTKISYF